MSSLEHNARLQAQWCEANDVEQAPHAKTHMSPEIVRLQLQSGAWGMAAASVHQARFLAATGVDRIILAHEVVDRGNATALARLAQEYPDVQVVPIVDSLAGVEMVAQHLDRAGMRNPLPVLVELGVTGGRTGVRDEADLIEIAEAVHGSSALTLAGVEGFEGILPVGRDEASLERIDAFLARLVAVTVELDRRDLFDEVTEVLLTAGGSVYPDRLAKVDRPELSVPLRLVVRSGATITHDHGASAAAAPLAPEADHPLGGLRPALDLWAAVVSAPEPGLALANFGKRDAPYDSRMPVVLQVLRNGEAIATDGVTVDRMNDQHAYVSHGGQVQVGDVLRLGPCHPCTAFDKWSLVPLLDDQDAVVGAITTWF
ncbi:alanine racemase [Sanguibacter sp. Z1732]|uniref:alanine racemase n=1 Tax=Sanguibacter sp. Z1732 TaxID=3435412 RepID=UPI003CB99EE2